jgi:hypothetical protein
MDFGKRTFSLTVIDYITASRVDSRSTYAHTS